MARRYVPRVADTGPLDVLQRCVRALDGDDRAGQRALTEAVAAAFDEPHHLIAEAPTGSGKSLAYLAAAVTSRRVTVVATATLALQDQLWRKDLPLVRDHGGVPFEAAVLKGRAQYLCLARLRAAAGGEALFDERPGPDFAAELTRLEQFGARSATGDAADLEGTVSPAGWRAVSCGPQECPGAARCASGGDCFAERARVNAEGADVLVVNHALYLADLAAGGGVLPPHDVVVFDEAHALADVATRALGSEVAPGGLRQLAGRVRAAGAPAADADGLGDAAERLEDCLGDLDGRVDPTEDRLAGILAAAAERIAAVATRLAREGDDPRAAQAAALATARLEAVRHLQAPGINEVAWVDGGDRPTLRLAPIDVGSRLAPVLFAARPCVLTSATLGPGGRFEPLARRLGLDPDATPPGDAAYAAARLESPFDVRNQAFLYVPRSLPDPRQPAWADAAGEELCALVAAAGGRALVLCTSRRAVERLAALLRERTTHPVLAQGDAANAQLLDRFAAEETSCLVANARVLAGHRRARPVLCPRRHRPAPVRPPRRPARTGPPRSRRTGRGVPVPGGRPAQRRARPRPGRRASAPTSRRPGRRRGARPAPRHRRLPAGAARRAPAASPHHRTRRGGRRAPSRRRGPRARRGGDDVAAPSGPGGGRRARRAEWCVADLVIRSRVTCPRATLSSISSAGSVQTKGLGAVVPVGDPVVDAGFELGDGGEAGVGQGLAAEHGEPALDEAEP